MEVTASSLLIQRSTHSPTQQEAQTDDTKVRFSLPLSALVSGEFLPEAASNSNELYCRQTLSNSSTGASAYSRCVRTEKGIAQMGGNGEITLLEGHYTITTVPYEEGGEQHQTPIDKSEIVWLSGNWSNGYPAGDMTFSRPDDDTHMIKSYHGTLNIMATKCEFIGPLQESSFPSNELILGKLYINGSPANGDHNVLIDECHVTGRWEDGEPQGEMRCTLKTHEKTLIYQGEMTIANDELVFHGQGVKEVKWGSGVTETWTGSWNEGSFCGEGEIMSVDVQENSKLELTTVVKRRSGTFNDAMLVSGTQESVVGIYRPLGRQHTTEPKETIFFQDRQETHRMTKKEDSKSGAITWPNGDSYEGEVDVKQGLPEGKGSLTCVAEGYTYRGLFENGQPHGNGTYLWRTGDKYTGQSVHGQRCGKGLIVWQSPGKKGHSYDGEFKDGQRMGRGIYSFPGKNSAHKVDGEWERRELKKRYFSDGRTYVGNFNARFDPEGHGIYTWPDGKTCEGNWNGALAKGSVIMTQPRVSKSTGPINKNFEFHGTVSTQLWQNNDWGPEVSQRWVNGVSKSAPLSTTSTTTSTSNAASTAKLTEQAPVPAISTPVENKPQGLHSKPRELKTVWGVYQGPANGNGLMHGTGVLKLHDGTSCTGTWNNGKPTGDFTFSYLDKSQYSGEVIEQDTTYQRNGKGVLTLQNGTVCDGQWKNDQPDGNITISLDNGWKYVGQAEVKTVSPVVTNRKKHKKEPPIIQIQWHGTGAIQDDNGELICNGKWSAGALTQRIYPDGRTYEGEINPITFQPHGKGIMHLVEDQRKCEASWDNGLPTGPATLIYADGSKFIGPLDAQLRPNGNGIKMLVDKTWIEGIWEKGVLKDHQAKLSFANGSMFQGTVDSQERPLEGVLTSPAGHSVTGKWTNGVFDLSKVTVELSDGTFVGPVNEQLRPDGEGVLTLKDGCTLTGQWANDVLDRNKVSLSFLDGGVFVGPVNDQYQPHGEGWYAIGENFEFSGEFDNGKCQPIAAEIKQNGINYRPLSNYSEDTIPQMTFYGEISWGAYRYTGWIEHGQPSGSGTLTLVNQFTLKGNFNAGKIDGPAYFFLNNNDTTYHTYFTPETVESLTFFGEMCCQGNYFYGAIENGQPQGDGNLFLSNGTNYHANFTPESYASLTFVGAMWHQGKYFYGPIEAGQPGGEGYVTLGDGTTYRANFNPEGYATLTFEGEMWRRGDYFQGPIRNGNPHGLGTFITASGHTLKGFIFDASNSVEGDPTV